MSKSITGLRIKDGVLQVSYDNGCHYEDIGQVGGADGKDGTNGSVCTIDPVTKHWLIDGVDTGVLAEGVDGINGNDGIDGMDGIDGIPYSIIAAPGENIAAVGTPSVNTSSDPITKTTTFTFNYLKGEKGDKGEDGKQGLAGKDGDTVGWEQVQNTGTAIANLTINGVTQTVYAPSNESASTSIVEYINSMTTDISANASITSITQAFFGVEYDGPYPADTYVNYSIFGDSDLAERLIAGNYKIATIFVRSGVMHQDGVDAFLPSSVFTNGSTECLIAGWGIQATRNYIKGAGSSTSMTYADVSTYSMGTKGLGPSLYCIHIKRSNSVSGSYEYAGFVIQSGTDGSNNVGIWGYIT